MRQLKEMFFLVFVIMVVMGILNPAIADSDEQGLVVIKGKRVYFLEVDGEHTVEDKFVSKVSVAPGEHTFKVIYVPKATNVGIFTQIVLNQIRVRANLSVRHVTFKAEPGMQYRIDATPYPKRMSKQYDGINYNVWSKKPKRRIKAKVVDKKEPVHTFDFSTTENKGQLMLKVNSYGTYNTEGGVFVKVDDLEPVEVLPWGYVKITLDEGDHKIIASIKKPGKIQKDRGNIAKFVIQNNKQTGMTFQGRPGPTNKGDLIMPGQRMKK